LFFSGVCECVCVCLGGTSVLPFATGSADGSTDLDHRAP